MSYDVAFWSTCKLTSTTDHIPIIYEGNTACINQLKLGFIKGDTTKHIASKFLFSHKQLQEKKIEGRYIGSQNNHADLFNKSLPKSPFLKHVRGTRICRLSELA